MQSKYKIYQTQNNIVQSNFTILINSHDILIRVVRNILESLEQNNVIERFNNVSKAGKVAAALSECFTQLTHEQKEDFESISNFYLSLYLKVFKIEGKDIEQDKNICKELIEGLRNMKELWMKANQ